MISDAELLLGLWRHLSAYAVNSSVAKLDGLAFAGRVYEMAWRLRCSGVSSAARGGAIAIEASIPPRQLRTEILPVLQTLGWIELQWANGELAAITETVPAPAELISLAPSVLAIAQPSAVERASIRVLRATTIQPLESSAAIDAAMADETVSEADAEAAVDVLSAVSLVRKVKDDDDRTAVFNPNVWVNDGAVTKAALRTEDARVRSEVGSLIEEVANQPGLPESQVRSTETRWIDFAVSHGLVQRSVVQTSDGSDQRFLFTPHLARDPFGGESRDPSGHARQLVGSMVYAATFAEYKLRSPYAFVRRLIQDGEAGDASPIGTDYPMLETAGIIRVVPGSREGKFRLHLLQADVAEETLKILGSRESGGRSTGPFEGTLRDQRSYTHLERERAKLANEAPEADADRRRLMSALRDTTARRGFDAH